MRDLNDFESSYYNNNNNYFFFLRTLTYQRIKIIEFYFLIVYDIFQSYNMYVLIWKLNGVIHAEGTW